LSSETDVINQLEARLAAQEHLIRHLAVTVLSRTDDPMEALEGFQKRLTAPLRRVPARTADDPGSEAEPSLPRILEIVDRIARNIREDIQHALSQLAGRRK